MNQQSEPEKWSEAHQDPREGETFVYRDSGVHENRGYIPLWLKLVAIALLVWAVYYTIAYWGPPPG